MLQLSCSYTVTIFLYRFACLICDRRSDFYEHATLKEDIFQPACQKLSNQLLW